MHAHYTQFLPQTKGQLNSKGPFAFFNSPKKRTKNFGHSRLGQKYQSVLKHGVALK